MADCNATGRGQLAATMLTQYRIEVESLFWHARQTGVPISAWLALFAVLIYMFLRYWFDDKSDKQRVAMAVSYRSAV